MTLFDRVRSSEVRRIAILIISHSLDQVFRLSDRICVPPGGQQISIRETASTDKNDIVSMIAGLH